MNTTSLLNLSLLFYPIRGLLSRKSDYFYPLDYRTSLSDNSHTTYTPHFYSLVQESDNISSLSNAIIFAFPTLDNLLLYLLNLLSFDSHKIWLVSTFWIGYGQHFGKRGRKVGKSGNFRQKSRNKIGINRNFIGKSRNFIGKSRNFSGKSGNKEKREVGKADLSSLIKQLTKL